MRISPINNTVTNTNYFAKTNNNSFAQTCPILNNADQVSFKGMKSIAIGWVLKGGYSVLKGTPQKIAYKEALGRSLARTEGFVKDKSALSDTIFALAKTPASAEPKFDLFYRLGDKFHSFSIKELKDYALKKLFPLTTECKEDANFSHAAKVALLRNMIDNGEYVDSIYFYKAFNDLPPEYDRDKESLAIQLLKDKNAKDNYIENNKRKNLDILTYKKYIADTALIRSMPVERHSEFFKNYANSINILYDYSFPYIIKMLTNRTEDGKQYAQFEGDKDLFYGFYKNGFVHEGYDYPIREQQYYKTLYPQGFDVYTQALFCDVFFNLMESYKDSPQKGAEDLNIDQRFFDDLVKDYNTLITASEIEDKNQRIELLQSRIKEKQNSGSYEIMDSIPGFMYLTGMPNELKPYTKSDVTTNQNLDYLMTAAPNYKYNNYDLIDAQELDRITGNIEKAIREEEEWVNSLSYAERMELENPWNVP